MEGQLFKSDSIQISTKPDLGWYSKASIRLSCGMVLELSFGSICLTYNQHFCVRACVCVCFWTFIVNTFDTPVGNFIFFTPGNKCSELLTPLSHHLIFTPSAGKFGALLFMLFKTYLGPFFCSWHTTGSLTTSTFKFKSNHSTEWNTFCAWKRLHNWNKGFCKWAQVWTKHNRLFN